MRFPALTYHTPTTKLLFQLRALLSNTHPTLQSKYIILLQTGSYNPIHLTHLSIFDAARTHIHATLPQHHVIAGYISPSHDDYVCSKLACEAIAATHRVKMAQLACQHSDWVDVDAWESLYAKHFVNFPSVAVRLRDALRKAHWEELGIKPQQVKVWYLGGADLFERAGIERLVRYGIQPVCAIRPEPGKCETLEEFMKRAEESWKIKGPEMVIVDGREGRPEDELSSTAVRKRIIEGKSIVGMVAPEVEVYLREHEILKEKRL